MIISSQDALCANDPKGALAELQADIRKYPQDPRLRIFLFQLSCVLGDYERALSQLRLLAEMDAKYVILAQTSRTLILCEALRSQIFEGKRQPTSFGDPLPWFGKLVRALALDADDQHKAAKDLRSEAFEAARVSSGTIDGTSFEWIADADPRLGPIAELIVDGRYFWVPFERITRLQGEGVKDLRDLVWLPLKITWSNGGEVAGYMPSRYPGTTASDDNALLMGTTTQWRAVHGDVAFGLGQRMLATDIDDYGLLAMSDIKLDTADDG